MSMKKISDLLLETTANYQPTSKLNVRFWNQDLNTSVLQFIVTRDNFPLSLSSENVKIIIALENGKNFISSDEFDISSEIDGVCSFQIPNDFMNVASGEVKGQVYVGTLDLDEVVVQRQFTFEVSQDLLSTIPSELKLQYIKTFSDLQKDIQDRITALEDDFLSMEDYVVSVQQATTDGLNTLNNLVNDKTIEYNDNHADKLALINNTVGDYVADFLNQRTYIDTKYAEFQTAVQGSGLVTDDDSADWQKYKMTNDDGSRIYLNKGSFADVNTLEPGYYETVSNDTNTQGFPTQLATAAFMEIDVINSGSGRKQIKVTQSSRGQTFVKYIHTNGEDNGWKEVLQVDDASSIETTLGAQGKANTAENNAKTYTDEKHDSRNAILFSGSVSNVGSSINLADSMYNYNFLIITTSYPGGTKYDIVQPASSITLQGANLSNATGMLLGIYEVTLTQETTSKLKISNDVAWVESTGASGPDKNAFTVIRIEGWR